MYVFIVNTRDNPVRPVLRKGELCNLFIPRTHQTPDAFYLDVLCPVINTLDHILVYQFKHILLFIIKKMDNTQAFHLRTFCILASHGSVMVLEL
jgi:hypothetical protein